jgi:hypothetical protein
MKPKIIIKLSFFFLALLVIFLAGCKKDNSTTTTSTPDTSSLQNMANDEANVNNASDEALNDINNVLSGGSGTMKATESLPCNATLDSTAVVNDTITYYITYNGKNCNGNLYRTGQIEIMKHVNTHWYQAGATVIYKYINYEVYHVLNPAKYIIMNGTKTYENVTGGLLFQLLTNSMDSIIHKEWGSMTITFENNTTRSWDVARQLKYTSANSKLILTTNGFGTADNFNNLVIWCLNRDNEQFYDMIIIPNVFRQVCNWDPCSGQKNDTIPAKSKGIKIIWGYDSNNQPITNGDCPTKYMVQWWINSNTGTMYLPLP